MKIDTKKIKSAALLTCGGFATFAGICIYKYNEKFYRDFVMPAIHYLNPEDAHKFAICINKNRILPKSPYKDPEHLKVTIFGHEISNPIGIAAGYDKHGEAVMGLRDMGFSMVEIGSVTPEPQPGNTKPRLFRLKEDKAVINRYGFNSEGHKVVFDRIESLNSQWKPGLLGVNLGKNKTSNSAFEDYTTGIEKFAGVADYLVINISSPNTPGLRNLQGENNLSELLKEVTKVRDRLPGKKPPILIKLAPDLSLDERKNIAGIIKKFKIDGLIISNTTTERSDDIKSANKNEAGGLSGQPIKDKATEMIADMYKFTNGDVTIIGVGGISDGRDAYEKIKAGATAIQIYTSLVYDGPPVVSQIKSELADLLQNDGYRNVNEAVGALYKTT